MTPDPPPAYDGGDLRRFRLSQGWTLQELSVWVGLHRGHLSRIERGLCPVPTPLRRILQLTGARHRKG